MTAIQIQLQAHTWTQFYFKYSQRLPSTSKVVVFEGWRLCPNFRITRPYTHIYEDGSNTFQNFSPFLCVSLISNVKGNSRKKSAYYETGETIYWHAMIKNPYRIWTAVVCTQLWAFRLQSWKVRICKLSVLRKGLHFSNLIRYDIWEMARKTINT